MAIKVASVQEILDDLSILTNEILLVKNGEPLDLSFKNIKTKIKSFPKIIELAGLSLDGQDELNFSDTIFKTHGLLNFSNTNITKFPKMVFLEKFGTPIVSIYGCKINDFSNIDDSITTEILLDYNTFSLLNQELSDLYLKLNADEACHFKQIRAKSLTVNFNNDKECVLPPLSIKDLTLNNVKDCKVYFKSDFVHDVKIVGEINDFIGFPKKVFFLDLLDAKVKSAEGMPSFKEIYINQKNFLKLKIDTSLQEPIFSILENAHRVKNWR